LGVSGAFKRTWLPALLAVLFFGIAGFALQRQQKMREQDEETRKSQAQA